MIRFLALILTSISIFWSSFTFSYSIPNHNLLTRGAIKLLQDCGFDNHNILNTVKDSLITANSKQDGLLTKTMMWHFPRPFDSRLQPPQSSYPGWPFSNMIIDPSFNNWFEYLTQQADKKENFKERVLQVGAIMHYIQDMSVPSHVAPIFHPSKLISKDPFDEWNQFSSTETEYSYPDDDDIEKEITLIAFSEEEKACACDQFETKNNAATILKDLYTATLTSIDKEINIENINKKIKWSLFWPKLTSDDKEGFKRYGCGNGRGAFGDENIVCGDNTYSIPFLEYKNFALQRAKEAIIASAKLILYYEYLDTDSLPECEDDKWIVDKEIITCLIHQKHFRDKSK